ncbi:aldo/keto reductase [Pseudooceanicola sp.]|uniref:aldo/keto reductase n=1 Tax=Pseudooceanicola sp. TaxID=1914328 RepID=UPI0035C6C907
MSFPHENETTGNSYASLVLGTAQFGSAYGVANRLGEPDAGRVRDVLDFAYENGIRVLDTAAAYGKSEAVLGACGMDGWSVITKIPSLHDVANTDVGTIAREHVLRSLDRLGVASLHAVLAHDRRDMAGYRGLQLCEALADLRSSGCIGGTGVSVYAPQDMEGIDLENIQVVQAPFNVLDQRFIASGEGNKLRANGAELHVRSVFLQGLLLMEPEDRPAQFEAWQTDLARFDKAVLGSGLTRAAFCLGFAARQADITHCVVGVENAEQLSQLMEAYNLGQVSRYDASGLRVDDLNLVDPRNWAAQK